MRERGYYGRFGGAYIPEILVATFDELEAAFSDAKRDCGEQQFRTTSESGPLCRLRGS